MSRWKLVFCVFLIAVVSAGQATPRDYTISLPRVAYTADGATAIVTFTISNLGGDAVEDSQVLIAEHQTGSIEIRQTLPVLAAGAEQEYAIQLQMTELPAGDVFFKIEAGIDQYELAGSPIARNNTQLFSVNKANVGTAELSDFTTQPISPASSRYDLFIPLVNLGIDFLSDGIAINGNIYRNEQIISGIALLVVGLFCLWLLSLILRLIFRRPPKFDTWQPPYAINTWYDANSALGRRQSWQFHAQSSVISAPCVPDQVTVIKRLLDKNGVALGSWKIRAIRTVQYDIYGRINRTEVLMPPSIVNKLNRVARRAPSLDNQELRKAVAPIAKRLGKRALAAVEKQNLLLPLALEMRFEGEMDNARILLELYQCRNDAWHMIDQWEPEMGEVGAKIPEHFSYTLNGQLSGESNREFKDRLRDDLAQLLAGLCYHHQADDPQHTPTEHEREPEPAAPSDENPAHPDEETDASPS